MALWDRPEIDDYLMDWAVDRRGDREDFSQDVAYSGNTPVER
jgi:hypothetical protein